MPKTKGAHHRGAHQVLARAVTAAAHADPDTRCWKCGRTLAQVREQEHKPRAKWIAGHVVRGQLGGPYLPECSVCSGREGAAITNGRPRTELSW